MILQVPEPASGGLLLSYRCSAECLHCMYGCSPRWSGDWIPEEDLRAILTQLAGRIVPAPHGSHGVSLSHGLHFTGGEPFLNYSLLLSAVRTAEELDIPSTFVETNCSWCTDDLSTREKMRQLRKEGLKGIMISVNPFFLEYVPFERTERAVRTGYEVFGDNLMVYQGAYFKRFLELGMEGTIPFERYIELEGRNFLFRNVEFFLMGRAVYTLAKHLGDSFPRHTACDLLNVPCQPPFLRNWHNHFDNYGNYMPGFCGGISLGDVRKLDILLEEGLLSEDYPILQFLTRGDFRGLLLFAEEQGYEEAPGGYLSKCHLCLDIRRHLSQIGEFEELKPAEFYLHLA